MCFRVAIDYFHVSLATSLVLVAQVAPDEKKKKLGPSQRAFNLSIVFLGLSHAIARDGGSGGSLRIMTVDKDGKKRETVDYTALPYALDAKTVM